MSRIAGPVAGVQRFHSCELLVDTNMATVLEQRGSTTPQVQGARGRGRRRPHRCAGPQQGG
eukprot:12855556-Alexandrium_andersonii.AAC.1